MNADNLTLIVLVPAAGMVLYALFAIFTTSSPQREKKQKRKSNIEPLVNFNDQKVVRLEEEVKTLEKELQEIRSSYAAEKSGFQEAINKYEEVRQELARRQEWVAASEEMLSKVRAENLELKNKFLEKEKESQDEFTKNVNLQKELREVNEKIGELERIIKEKSEQIEIQRHRIEKNEQDIKGHLKTIDDFKKKEKISEWVPKAEFNKLNEEYTELEKELEEGQGRLKSFAEEIAHLRKQVEKGVAPQAAELKEQVEEIKDET
ncbi:MAG: hypothetical protein PHI09_01480, partial [Candidatus Omnitrophica bacterium]|nr:hypothetical protein [Candidatus Omnitrophota bacterium]